MNQILLREKLYVTPELRRKKKMYKIRIFISLFLICLLIGYYVYAEIERKMEVGVSADILTQLAETTITTRGPSQLNNDNTTRTIINDVLIVELDREESDAASEGVIIGVPEDVEETPVTVTTTANNGVNYTTESILNIPSLGINYPVLSETSEELLKISLNKYWGGRPNAVGNYCIVGHNYANGTLFGKLASINIGDTCVLTDMLGREAVYEVYDKYVVEPEDTSCTSQLTNGRVEMTLITCKEYGTRRLVVKCRKI